MISDKLLEKIKSAQKKNSTFDKSKSKWLALKANEEVVFRVLFGEYGDDGLFYHKNGIHILPNKERIICRKLTNGGECPICDEVSEIRNLTSEKKVQLEVNKKKKLPTADLEAELEVCEIELKKLYPLTRWLMNVVVKGESTAKIYAAPWSVFNDIWSYYTKNIGEGIDILDAKTGHDIQLTKTGSGRHDTKYITTVCLSPRSLGSDEEIESINSTKHDLNKECKDILSFELAKEAYENYLAGGEPILVKKKKDNSEEFSESPSQSSPGESEPIQDKPSVPSQVVPSTPVTPTAPVVPVSAVAAVETASTTSPKSSASALAERLKRR